MDQPAQPDTHPRRVTLWIVIAVGVPAVVLTAVAVYAMFGGYIQN